METAPELNNQISSEEENLLTGVQLKLNSIARFWFNIFTGVTIGTVIFICFIKLIYNLQFINLFFFIFLLVLVYFLYGYLLYIRPLQKKEMQYFFTNKKVIFSYPKSYFLSVLSAPLWYYYSPPAAEKFLFGCYLIDYKDILNYKINIEQQSCVFEIFAGRGLLSLPIKYTFFPQPEHLRKIEEILSYYVKQ